MEQRNNAVSIVVIGSLWGITEATLGYLVHILSFFSFYGISGIIMSAVAVYFMRMAFKTTHKLSSIFYVSVIAAGIKLFDLFLPMLPASKTIGPAIAILSEGLVIMLGYALFSKGKKYISLSLFGGISWRIFYLATLFILGYFTPHTSISAYILSFILLQGMLNAIFIYPVLKIKNIKALRGELAVRPEFAIILFSLAVSLELILKTM